MPKVAEAQAEVIIYTYGKLTNYPPSPKYVVNVSEWRNPECNKEVNQNMDGRSPKVLIWMEEEKRVGLLSKAIKNLVNLHLGPMKEAYFSIGLMDHKGKWIAPAVGEILVRDLSDRWKVAIKHFELPMVN